MKLFRSERLGLITLAIGLVFFFIVLLINRYGEPAPIPVDPDKAVVDSLSTLQDTAKMDSAKSQKKTQKKKAKKIKPTQEKTTYKRNHRDENVN